MIYITVKQSPSYHQMTLEEFLFNPNPRYSSGLINKNTTNTRTYEVATLSPIFKQRLNLVHLIKKLSEFNEKTKELSEVPVKNCTQRFLFQRKAEV